MIVLILCDYWLVMVDSPLIQLLLYVNHQPFSNLVTFFWELCFSLCNQSEFKFYLFIILIIKLPKKKKIIPTFVK